MARLPPVNSALYFFVASMTLAALAELLLVQARDDAATPRRGIFAVFLVVCLAGGALRGGQGLRENRTGETGGDDENGESKFRRGLQHETSGVGP
jgi:hypothetical protein